MKIRMQEVEIRRIRAQLDVVSPASTAGSDIKSSCPLLEKIPAEVRNLIYEYLLVNPALSQLSGI